MGFLWKIFRVMIMLLDRMDNSKGQRVSPGQSCYFSKLRCQSSSAMKGLQDIFYKPNQQARHLWGDHRWNDSIIFIVSLESLMMVASDTEKIYEEPSLHVCVYILIYLPKCVYKRKYITDFSTVFLYKILQLSISHLLAPASTLWDQIKNHTVAKQTS